MVQPMLSDRCLVCLSCLDVTMVSVWTLVFVSILFPAPATSSCAIGVGWCSQDSSPRVHPVRFRLLQLSSIRHRQHPAPAVTGHTCSALGHWHPKVWQHFPRSRSNYTGYQCDNEWNLSSLSWSTRRWTAWHHHICQTIASSLPLPDAVSYDHQCIITCTSSHIGHQAFAAARPCLLNSLPTQCLLTYLFLDIPAQTAS